MIDELIDTNVWLSHWPTRRAWAETTAQLVTKLRAHGVTSAWAGSFDAALHSDIAGANARLAEACTRDGGGLLVPIGCVNPTLPDWEDDVRRCADLHHMPGMRLLPNYHGYSLDDARFARLLDLAAQRRLLVQIALSVEDDRSQNPAFTAAPVQAAPLADVVEKFPHARVMLLNSGSRILGTNPALLQRLSKGGVFFEIATLESVAGIESLLQKVPAARLAFGSHAPYFYFEAALLKLQESALTPAQLAALRHGQARAALTPS
ncbi:MAG: metal-dependent hydrolase [Opitutus sp.]|nr:metal-dependent hydrolase [Opitutus sp.]